LVSCERVLPLRVVRRIRVARRALRYAVPSGATEYPYPPSFPGAGGVVDAGGALSHTHTHTVTHTHIHTHTHILSLSLSLSLLHKHTHTYTHTHTTPGKALGLPIHVTLPRLTSGRSDRSHTGILDSQALHVHLGSLRQVMTLGITPMKKHPFLSSIILRGRVLCKLCLHRGYPQPKSLTDLG
jgi:hypothetical protein